jgi:zinc transporter ZupT
MQERLTMNMSRRLGILVFCMVPAIIGGGIVYGIFGDYVPVFVYEAILVVVAGALVSK